MAKRRVSLLFKNFPTEFPHNLEKDYSRILEKLMHLWALPEFDYYIQELLVNSRIDRHGFPPAVVDELLFIQKLHDMCREKNISLPPITNNWNKLLSDSTTQQAFQLSLLSGDMNRIRNYLAAGIPVDYQFEDGSGTPLIVASFIDQVNVVSLLIKLDAEVNARDSGKNTPLHWAAYYGHLAVINLLLDNGARIDEQNNTGATPLLLAVMRNKIQAVELLLQHGACVKINGNDGTPLDVAFQKNAKDIFKLLVIAEKGVKKDR
jgi:hypothetical protein